MERGHMMAPRDVLARASAAGVVIRTDGDRLRVECRSGAPAPEVLELLRDNKPAIVAYLTAPPVYGCASCGRFAFSEPDFNCYWCRRALASLPLGPPCDGCGESCERCLGVVEGQP